MQHTTNAFILNISPRQAKILLCALGAVIAAVDIAVPANINLGIFYLPLVVLLARTRSFRWLWASTAAFILLIFAGLVLSPPAVAQPISWVDWLNRSVTAGVLVIVAISIHLHIRNVLLREQAIAERRRAEAALVESEARLRLAQKAANIGSWEWSPATRQFTCSAERFEILGMEPAASCSSHGWIAGIDAEDRDRVSAAFEQCAKQQGSFDLEYRYHHPTRGPRWIHGQARTFHDESGTPRLFGVSRDITDQKKTQDALRESLVNLEAIVAERTSALRQVSARLLRAQEEECRKISRELHDSLGQYLVALKLNITLLARSASGEQSRVLAESLDLVGQAIVETRTLSYLLHPPMLDEAGFVSAARGYVRGFANRSGIRVDLQAPEKNIRFAPAVELVLFRILQECLTNVHRHSGSSSVSIRFDAVGDRISLMVRDYGRGLPEELLRKFNQNDDTAAGLGLAGMRERIGEFDGGLTISAADPGTLITATIPISANQAGAATASRATGA